MLRFTRRNVAASRPAASRNRAVRQWKEWDERTPNVDGVDVWFWFGELAEPIRDERDAKTGLRIEPQIDATRRLMRVPSNERHVPPGYYIVTGNFWGARGPFKTASAAINFVMPALLQRVRRVRR